MASGGGESSENNQYIPPNEDETTVYQNTEGIVCFLWSDAISVRHRERKNIDFFFMRLNDWQ